MPKAKVERTSAYRLTAMIRGEMTAQGVTPEKAAQYARVGRTTLYRLFDDPMAYFPAALRLMRCLSIPIEEVRAAISYPW